MDVALMLCKNKLPMVGTQRSISFSNETLVLIERQLNEANPDPQQIFAFFRAFTDSLYIFRSSGFAVTIEDKSLNFNILSLYTNLL